MNDYFHGNSHEELFPGYRKTLVKECNYAQTKHFYPAWFTLFDGNKYWDAALVGFISCSCTGTDTPCPFS